MGERVLGVDEVGGSNPPASTSKSSPKYKRQPSLILVKLRI